MLTRKEKRGFRFAFLSALKSNSRHHRMGCSIIKGGSILSQGWNLYSKLEWKEPQRLPTRHAEQHAVANTKTNLYGSTIFVLRITPGNHFSTSKPCKNCMNKIREMGIRTVYYISKSNMIVRMRIGQPEETLCAPVSALKF